MPGWNNFLFLAELCARKPKSSLKWRLKTSDPLMAHCPYEKNEIIPFTANCTIKSRTGIWKLWITRLQTFCRIFGKTMIFLETLTIMKQDCFIGLYQSTLKCSKQSGFSKQQEIVDDIFNFRIFFVQWRKKLRNIFPCLWTISLYILQT